MKRSNLAIALAFAISILMTSVVAQNVAPTVAIKATIPFDFTIAKQTLAAGEYTIRSQGTLLQLVRIDGPGLLLVPKYIAAHQNNVTPRLLFHRYGTRNFLAQVWTTDTVHELLASAREIEYARTDKQEQVVVLASALTK
jgi:hypothetical protein